jgi:hypothetical protein
MTQDQNTRVTENSIIHVGRSEKSVNTKDWAPLSMWVSEFSVTLMLWSCVTLGFSNSVVSAKIKEKLVSALIERHATGESFTNSRTPNPDPTAETASQQRQKTHPAFPLTSSDRAGWVA